jgi:glycine cleavage system T protein
MGNELPAEARVVIIGGGVAGCSIAYHLTKMGWTDVVLVERGELTCGSTWHAAGLVGQLRSDFNLTRMMMYSANLYRQLKAETGQDTGFHEAGTLRLASSDERIQELNLHIGHARSFGLPLDFISLKEAKEMFPLADMTGVKAAAFAPSDGYIDPNGLTMALAAGARSRGARIHTDTKVSAIGLEHGRVSHVMTSKGRIRTEIVVNAAGQWGREVGRMVGIDLPVVPMAHQYLVTKPIEGVRHEFPTLRDPDMSLYWREEVGGLIVGGYEDKPVVFGMEGIPEDFQFKLLPPDWETFGPLMERAVRRTPAVADAEILRLLNGPEAFTPDGEPILGPTEVGGFWVACALCARGLGSGGAVGKTMAEWIIDGKPEWDTWRLDVRRFGSNHASKAFDIARTAETYGRFYVIHYPGEEREAGRPQRLSPMYGREHALGAVFGEKCGWERPNWYEPHAALAGHDHLPHPWARVNWSPAIGYESLQTREAAGLYDMTSFSKIEVSGPGALRLLQYLCANEIDMPVGRVVYTSMLNARGGIEADLTVTRVAEDRFLLITGTAFGRHDADWIRAHSPDNGSVMVNDVTSAFACVGVWGPKARRIVERTTDTDVSDAGFPYLTSRRMAVGNVPTLALRVTYVGELGWEFYFPPEYGESLWSALWEAGQAEGMVAGGYKAIDSLRLEKGYRYWSGDIGPNFTPLEAGLGFAVKLGKDDFLGKDALLKQRGEGLTRKLCCLTLADPNFVVVGNEPIMNGKEVIGWVTSGGYGYAVGKSIAYGYLPLPFDRIGSKLEIDILGNPIAAEVVREPLWDPRGERIRS